MDYIGIIYFFFYQKKLFLNNKNRLSCSKASSEKTGRRRDKIKNWIICMFTGSKSFITGR
jgi:hypothetical protein